LDKNRTTKLETPEENILIVLAPAEIVQTVIPKSMVPDLEYFDRDWTKFEDW